MNLKKEVGIDHHNRKLGNEMEVPYHYSLVYMYMYACMYVCMYVCTYI